MSASIVSGRVVATWIAPIIVRERIGEEPELALDVLRLNLEIADRCLELGIPIHETLVAVDQAALVELDEDVGDRALVALIHRKSLVRPVATGAEAAQLPRYRSAGLSLPFPDMLEESLAADLRSAETWLSRFRSTTI